MKILFRVRSASTSSIAASKLIEELTDFRQSLLRKITRLATDTGVGRREARSRDLLAQIVDMLALL